MKFLCFLRAMIIDTLRALCMRTLPASHGLSPLYIYIYFSALGSIMLIKIVTFAMFIVPYSDLSSLVNCLRSWILGEMVRNAPRRLCM